MKGINGLAAALTMLVLAPAVAHAQQLGAQHGSVDFPISCNEEAQDRFSTGLALMHHMMYDQAEPEFAAAAEADPTCAMAHWGVAMTVIHPLWGERPGDEAQKKGFAAVERAKELTPPTDRERAYVAAAEAFFRGWEDATYPAQLASWGAAQKLVYEANPDDVDAGAFYALSLLALAPKEDKTLANQKEAGALLERLHATAPEHPGLFHYLIHAYDNPALANKGMEVARGYDRLAPDVPHALHMPSHIFVRLGVWPDVISWNRRSAEAALAQPVGGMTSRHYAHALDYLAYGYLQRGEDQAAQEIVSQISAVDNFQPALATAYALAAVPARYTLERRDWTAAANLPARANASFAWDTFPGAESITHFARGLGAARTGDAASARNSIEEIDALYDRMVSAGDTYWSVLADAQRKAVAAWLALEEGRNEQALALMTQAADLEDSVDKSPVTPSAVLPARELLGDILVELGRPEEAMAAYDMALKISPNRFNSLYGAALAAEMGGDDEKAKVYYAKLSEIVAPEAAQRLGPDQAKRIFSGQ